MPFEDEAVIMDPAVTTAQDAQPEGAGLRVVPNSLVFKAVGETKTFTILTKTGVTPTIDADNSGFTATAGTTTAGVTTVTVVCTGNEGNFNSNVGQVVVKLPLSNRSATVTLDQRAEDLTVVTP